MIISYCAPDGAPGYGGGAPREGGGPFEEAEEPPGACWYRWMMRVIADQSIQGKETKVYTGTTNSTGLDLCDLIETD